MKKKKSFFSKKYGALGVLFVLLVSGFFLFKYFVSISQVPFVGSREENNLYYPTLYSDTHINQTAILTDQRFKEITFSPQSSLVANAISSVSSNTYNATSGMEQGTWLWTPVMHITPSYRNYVISGAKKNGVKNIYISLDSYLDIYVISSSTIKDQEKKEFSAIVENFIRQAHQNGITVDAEAGWRNWSEPGNEYKAYAVLNYVTLFNKTHTEKFRGFQYDVEPYMLDNFKNDTSNILSNYISLIDRSVSFLDKSDLQLSVVVPEFYDGSISTIPAFSYNGVSKFPIDHLLTVLDHRAGSKIIVMSYRNFSQGDDGSIDISQSEITRANTHQTKVIVAQETGDVLPPYVTFHNTSRSYFNRQEALIVKAFHTDKSFGGLATHYVNTFLNLK